MGPWTALVVDDSPTVRLLISAALRRIPGVTCLEARDGAEGIRRLTERRFDLVLTDINMPVLGGLALVSYLRSHSETHAVPVLVVTTEGAKEDQERLLAAGANGYLTKPIKAQQLIDRVRELLSIPASG